MSYCPFSLHKKSLHLWYLAYISSRIFQKGIIHRILLFLPIHFTDKFPNVSYYFLLIVSFSPSSLNVLIAIAFFLILFKGLTFPLRLNDAVKSHLALHKKLSFPLRIASVNVTKSADSCGFRHIY